MISCERSSILFSRAQRPLTTTTTTSSSSSSSSSTTTATTTSVGTNSCLFSGHTTAAPFCFSRGDSYHAGSGNTNANGSCNNSNNNNNNTVMYTSSAVAAGVAAASHFAPSRPRDGDGGGQGYSTGGHHATNFAGVGTATTVALENLEGGMVDTGAMGTEDNNGEADDEGMKRTSSSNDEPTPETCTDTTPRTVIDEVFAQPHEGQQQQNHHHHQEEEQQQQQQQQEGDALQEQQRGCTFSQGTPPLSCNSREDACKSEVSNEDGKDVDVTGATEEAEACEMYAFSPVVVSVRKPLQSQIDLVTARVAVTLFLENLSEDNKAEPVLTSDFHSHRLPQMPIEAYLDRVVRHSGVSGETLIASLMLLLKYSHFINHPVSVYNVHRLTITSLLLGAKLRDDQYYSNEYYSRIGGISNAEINKLELRFCGCLEWDMWLDESEYETLENLLLRLVTVFASNMEEIDEVTRRRFQRQFWVEELRPWKERFDVSSSQRRERIRRCAAEDFSSEQAKIQCLSPSGFLFPQNPLVYPGTGIPGVSLDQIILPAVYRQTSGGTVSNAHTTTLVTVIAQNAAGSTTSIPTHYHHSYHPIYQPPPRQQMQYGCGVYDTNNNINNNNNNTNGNVGNIGSGRSTNAGAGFGILERAVSLSPTTPTTRTTTTTGLHHSGISIHAKPYHYKSRGSSTKKFFNKPHRYHYASSQQMDSCHDGDIAMMDATTATYCSSSSRQNSIHNNNYNNSNNYYNNNEMEFASITSTVWRPSGTNNNNNNNSSGRRPATSDSATMERHSGGGGGGGSAVRGSGPLVFPSQPQPCTDAANEEVAERRNRRKRPKPDHYRDYR
ncbi:CYC2-like cyclin 4 (CYC4) [Trypanosoma cruzi cruzi]|nr:CYC2-like cyclin 4 (CYC4) [Trypanosoma cruzi cruzi]